MMRPSNVRTAADTYKSPGFGQSVAAAEASKPPGNPGADILIRTNPNRGQINDSFWFELPSTWLGAGSLTLTARLDPANAVRLMKTGPMGPYPKINPGEPVPRRDQVFLARYF